MPRVPDELLEAVVFLYESEEDAEAGVKTGGTGFLVEYRSRATGKPFTYLVTNKHVSGALCDVVRANLRDGGFDLYRVRRKGWVPHPDGDDVAVAALEVPPSWKVSPLRWDVVAPTPSRMAELNIGVGDDVVMVGRFRQHEGRETNQPLIRFGNIALMPGEKVIDGRYLLVDAYLVEMRSLPGFSGSPVFIYLEPGSYRGDKKMMPFNVETIGLLGIDTGHKHDRGKVFQGNSDKPVDDSWQVRQNTGVAIVAPYWKILDVLREDVFMKQRSESDRDDLRQTEEGASADVAVESEWGRFEDLAKKIVQVPKGELDTERKRGGE